MQTRSTGEVLRRVEQMVSSTTITITATTIECGPGGDPLFLLSRLASQIVELIIYLVSVFWLVQTESSLGAKPA